MDNIKLLLTYDGTRYSGWQKTGAILRSACNLDLGPRESSRGSTIANGAILPIWTRLRSSNRGALAQSKFQVSDRPQYTLSIEQTLEDALTKILQHPVKLQAASRTDAGVHAEGQVVNFFLCKPFDLSRLKTSLNGILPKDIAILSVEKMADAFHPTLDCVKKEYWYNICNSETQLPFYRATSWHFPYPLDTEAMRKESVHLLGTHDFSAFCNALKIWDRDPVCRLEKIEIVDLHENRVRIALTGDRFLYRMARNLAGTLAYIGCGKLKIGSTPAILKNKDRTQAGMTPPASGLTLKHVYYDL